MAVVNKPPSQTMPSDSVYFTACHKSLVLCHNYNIPYLVQSYELCYNTDVVQARFRRDVAIVHCHQCSPYLEHVEEKRLTFIVFSYTEVPTSRLLIQHRTQAPPPQNNGEEPGYLLGPVKCTAMQLTESHKALSQRIKRR